MDVCGRNSYKVGVVMGMIEEKDYNWLMFLFYCDGVSRAAEYDWYDKFYLSSIRGRIYLYGILYPIMLIWSGCRYIKSKFLKLENKILPGDDEW